MRSGLLLRVTYTPPSFLLVISQHQQWTPTTYSFFTNPSSSLFLRQIHAKNRRWDSNAETFRTQNFNFDSLNDDDGDDDDEDDDTDQWFEVLEEFIDGVWIFKVFKSFGWMLPAIISSLLLATGPKAFLMALALPLGQSALSLAFQKVWGRTKNKQKRKGKTKKKPRVRTTTNVDLDDDEEEEIQGSRKGKMGYQTWVAGNDKNTQDSPSFGGWEELDRRAQFNARARRSAQTGDEKRKTLKSKLSKRERKGDMPLLLRLLIAVFPFLGSWTKML